MILARKGNKTFALRREMKTKEENSMKEKVTALVCFNLVNANGVKLRLYLGRDEGYADCYGNPDKGFRWSFVGSKIPMPVRAYTWFNGFPENTMLDWLKGNGWALRSRVEMGTGKATIYELPKADEPSKGNNIPELKKEVSAQEAYNAAISVALENAMKKISEAKDKGYTSCYISSVKGKLPVEVIQSLLNAGYDIKYNVFNKGYGDWFIEAFWHRICDHGKLFRGGSFDDPNEVSIQVYKSE